MNGIAEDIFDEVCDLDSIKEYVIPKLLDKVSMEFPNFEIMSMLWLLLAISDLSCLCFSCTVSASD